MILRAGDEPIPGYRLEEFLGKGQFGQVWKARSPGKAFCALKFLDLSGKQGRKEFRAIQRVKEIRHAHLMPITALWLLDEEGNVLNDAAMEGMGRDSTLVSETLAVPNPDEPAKPALLVVAQLLGDKTLGDRLEECALDGHQGIPVDELLTYMEEAAKGIDYLNAEKYDLGSSIFAIQHCDIKPANILLAGDSVLICDYGVAQALADSGSRSKSTGMVGSPAYMAPECISDQPSSASDQYSLAVTYYELRTGSLPFTKTTFADVMDAHRNGKLDLSLLSPDEKKVIAKATAVDPRKRFHSAVEMVRQLRRAALGTPMPAAKWRGRIAVATIVLFVGCLMGAYVASEWFVSKSRTIRFVLEPPGGELTISGKRQTLGADGAVDVDCESDSNIEIVATCGLEFLERRETIPVASITDPVFQVRLEHNPTFYAERSQQLLNRGDFHGAVAAWARALSYDKSGDLRSVPRPVIHRASPNDRLLLASACPSTRWIGAVDSTGGLRLWRSKDISEAVVVSPANKTLGWKPHSLTMSDAWAVLSFQNGQVSVIDLTSSPPVEKFSFNVQERPEEDEFHKELIELAITPDQRYLVTTTSDAGSLTKTLIHRWDLRHEFPKTTRVLVGRHEAPINAIEVDKSSAFATSVSWDGTVRKWPLENPSDGEFDDTLVAEHSSEVYCLAQGESIVAFGGEGWLLESTSESGIQRDGEHRVTVCRENCRSLSVSHSAPIDLVALSSTERWLVSGCEESELYVWDTRTSMASPIVLRNGHRGRVNSVCFSADEEWMVSAGEDGQVLLWDFQDSEKLGPLRLKTSPESATLVVVNQNQLIAFAKDGIQIWNLPRCMLIKRACDDAGVAPTPTEEPDSSLVDA